jgi:hypothetical protein
MAYTITLSNGTLLTTIQDGTVNQTSTSLALIGKNYAGYGTFLNSDLVHILENFASVSTGGGDSSAIPNPLTGQLWWDLAGNLKVYTGSTWRTMSTMTSSNTQPTGSKTGNAWWDTNAQQLNIYNGSSWVLIGPAFTSNVGQSGVSVGQIADSNPLVADHVAVNVFVGTTLIGIISRDQEYTPADSPTGFTTIKPGFNLASAQVVGNIAFVGNATNSNNLGSQPASSYARTDIATTFANTININNNSGLTVGTGNNFTVSVTGDTTQLVNNVNGGNLQIVANVLGVSTPVLTVNGQNGVTSIANLNTTGAFVTSGYIQTTQGDNATSNVTGAVRVTGGIGLTGNLFTSNSVITSGNIVANGRVQATGNVSTAAYLLVTGGEAATSNVTGAVRISGGMSLSGAIFAQGNVNGAFFNGVAINALYADLAERFEADAYYQPGTVLTMGGEKEVTLANEELSDDVFGVVSTRAAYLMNSQAGSNETHPPVAVSGRVPVKVIGSVCKGDRLVSAGQGMARAASKSEVTPYNVIGRALENKVDTDVGTVMAIVKLNS